jgi:hypothetical protein
MPRGLLPHAAGVAYHFVGRPTKTCVFALLLQGAHGECGCIARTKELARHLY